MSGFIGNVQSVAIADVQDNSVETSDIQDGAVTQDKIHSSVVLGNTTRIHAFNQDSNGNLIWTHSEGTLAIKDNNNNDIYLDVLIGASDQVYSINSDGELICTFT